MATSHYFTNFSQTKTNEQRLLEDLVVESIKINGHDIFYMPREDWEDTDMIFGENLQSKFERAYQMEMYIANVEGWGGKGDLFTKFGLEIRDNSNFVVAKRTFEKYMPNTVARRPREGDLLFVPVMNKIFEIVFVEQHNSFFARGNRLPYMYELRCEDFRYSNEVISTGVERIDEIRPSVAFNMEFVLSGTGAYDIGEQVFQGANLAYASATATVGEWDNTTRKLQIFEIKGSFSNTSNIVGVVSGTSSAVTSDNTFGENPYYDLYNNKDIQDEANNVVVLVPNPFGNP
jgi:hypothetical protein